MTVTGNYLTVFPTPGGDKHHMFRFTSGSCQVVNSIGPTPLSDFILTADGFSGDMAAGPTTHRFSGVMDGDNIKVEASVIDGASGDVINRYSGVLVPFEGDAPPADPDTGGGPGGPGGPPPQH